MARTASTAALMAIMAGVFLGLSGRRAAGFAAEQTVKLQSVDDRKAVIATVEPVRQLLARARIGGTITSLTVKEGDRVNAGDRIAVIVGPEAAVANASPSIAHPGSTGQSRSGADQFRPRSKAAGFGNVSSQAQLDQARTSPSMSPNAPFRRCCRTGKSFKSKCQQGAVLAPGDGRVLKVPVSEGSVAMPGETIAIIAADKYILRLQLPERHAQFMKAGDTILIGARGLAGAVGGTRDIATRQGGACLSSRSNKDG